MSNGSWGYITIRVVDCELEKDHREDFRGESVDGLAPIIVFADVGEPNAKSVRELVHLLKYEYTQTEMIRGILRTSCSSRCAIALVLLKLE